MTAENQKIRDALKAAESIIVSALAHQPEDGCACNKHLVRAVMDADRVLCRAAGLPFDEEVFCTQCGKKLDKVMLHKFAFNGDEYDDDFPVDFSAQFLDGGDIGISICTDRNWCGYELSEKEQAENISCPHCGKFPFSDKHIEVAEPDQVDIVCWTSPGVPKKQTSPASAPQGEDDVASHQQCSQHTANHAHSPNSDPASHAASLILTDSQHTKNQIATPCDF